jgi:hypothetical protein
MPSFPRPSPCQTAASAGCPRSSVGGDAVAARTLATPRRETATPTPIRNQLPAAGGSPVEARPGPANERSQHLMRRCPAAIRVHIPSRRWHPSPRRPGSLLQMTKHGNGAVLGVQFLQYGSAPDRRTAGTGHSPALGDGSTAAVAAATNRQPAVTHPSPERTSPAAAATSLDQRPLADREAEDPIGSTD